MPDWVRVKDEDTGHELSVQESTLAHGKYTQLKKEDAVDVNGDPLPPKFNEKQAATPAATTGKES